METRLSRWLVANLSLCAHSLLIYQREFSRFAQLRKCAHSRFHVAPLFLRRLRKTAPNEETPSPNGRSFAYAATACVLLGVVGVMFTPGDKAEGETLVLFAKSSPYFRRAATPVMDRAAFLQTVKDLGI